MQSFMSGMDTFISRVREKLEFLRLEQRYAKRTHRTGYRANAEYHDGEYIIKPPPAPRNGRNLTKKLSERNINVRAMSASRKQ